MKRTILAAGVALSMALGAAPSLASTVFVADEGGQLCAQLGVEGRRVGVQDGDVEHPLSIPMIRQAGVRLCSR